MSTGVHEVNSPPALLGDEWERTCPCILGIGQARLSGPALCRAGGAFVLLDILLWRSLAHSTFSPHSLCRETAKKKHRLACSNDFALTAIWWLGKLSHSEMSPNQRWLAKIKCPSNLPAGSIVLSKFSGAGRNLSISWDRSPHVSFGGGFLLCQELFWCVGSWINERRKKSTSYWQTWTCQMAVLQNSQMHRVTCSLPVEAPGCVEVPVLVF